MPVWIYWWVTVLREWSVIRLFHLLIVHLQLVPASLYKALKSKLLPHYSDMLQAAGFSQLSFGWSLLLATYCKLQASSRYYKSSSWSLLLATCCKLQPSPSNVLHTSYHLLLATCCKLQSSHSFCKFCAFINYTNTTSPFFSAIFLGTASMYM